MTDDNPMNTAMGRLAAPSKPRKEKIPNELATRKRRGKRGLTVYIDPVAHADLDEIKREEDSTFENLIIEGLNYVLQKRGKPVIA